MDHARQSILIEHRERVAPQGVKRLCVSFARSQLFIQGKHPGYLLSVGLVVVNWLQINLAGNCNATLLHCGQKDAEYWLVLQNDQAGLIVDPGDRIARRDG